MNQGLTAPEFTPEDLLTMPDRENYELVDGKPVEKPASFWSSYVGGITYAALLAHCRAHHLGWVVPDGTTYQCFPFDPTRVRRTDVSFIRLERMPLARATEEGHVRIAPDLAIEVISPNELAYDLDARLVEYLMAGVPLVWVINPQSRIVHVYRPDGSARLLREQDELDGEMVVPGFRFPVRDLFVPPTPPTANGGRAA